MEKMYQHKKFFSVKDNCPLQELKLARMNFFKKNYEAFHSFFYLIWNYILLFSLQHYKSKIDKETKLQNYTIYIDKDQAYISIYKLIIYMIVWNTVINYILYFAQYCGVIA